MEERWRDGGARERWRERGVGDGKKMQNNRVRVREGRKNGRDTFEDEDGKKYIMRQTRRVILREGNRPRLTFIVKL